MTDRADTERSTARPITLPEHIGERIDRRIERTRFESREEYVVEALTQLLFALESEDEFELDARDPGEERTAELENQLESLGYL